MICCCKKEPIPEKVEIAKRIAFWGAFVVFFVVYAILINNAVEANKSYEKPASLGMLIGS